MPSDPSTAVIELTWAGGTLPLATTIAVYAHGRVVRMRTETGFPPAIDERTLPPARVDELVGTAIRCGLATTTPRELSDQQDELRRAREEAATRVRGLKVLEADSSDSGTLSLRVRLDGLNSPYRPVDNTLRVRDLDSHRIVDSTIPEIMGLAAISDDLSALFRAK